MPMSDESASTALRRLARDLRQIREDRAVSIEDIHDATQIPRSDLKAFESGSFYEDSKLGPVYLRAFVRAYAGAIDLPPDDVTDLLRAAQNGDYQNQLAVRFLGASPSPEQGDSEDPSGNSSPEAADAQPSDRSSNEAGESDAVSGSESRPPTSSGAEGQEDDDTESSPETSADPGHLPQRSYRIGLIVVLLLLLLGGAVLFTVYFSGTEYSSSTEASSAVQDSVPDTSQETVQATTSVDTTQAPQSPLADLSLGDTVHVTVLATSDVRELRVQQDDHLRRPYWIEVGEAMVFPFTRRITLQNQLDRFRLLLEQHPYPVSRTDEQGRVVIRRADAQRFADTLRANSVSVPATPDTAYGTPPELPTDSLESLEQGVSEGRR